MLTLYNTLSKKKETFRPLKKNEVGLYTCGLTVYNYAHIGNLRTYVFEDILKRTLKANDYKVKHVMNITDVGHLTSDADEGEDKMEAGATREKKTVWEIAEFYTKAFKQDLADLNIIEPDIWCKATDHIKEQIEWIKKLEEKGLTYKISDGVYFNTSKFPAYGQLTGQKPEELKEGARVDKNPEKKNPTDFALWKFSPKNKQRAMEWDSPWGKGFPGWHLECSVMAQKYLGETFDIHCGGIDHIAVHHTNEIAQAEAVTGKPFVNYWLHGEFLVIPGRALLKDNAGFLRADQYDRGKLVVSETNIPINNIKMSKSAGNFITLHAVKEKGIDPLAFRYFALGTHYRQRLNFSWEALESKWDELKNLYNTTASQGQPGVGCINFEKHFMKEINDDLNTPKALAIVLDLIKSNQPPEAKKASLLKFDEILGLNLAQYKTSKTTTSTSTTTVTTTTTPSQDEIINEQEIARLSALRDKARLKQDWKKADELRDKIIKRGGKIKDDKIK